MRRLLCVCLLCSMLGFGLTSAQSENVLTSGDTIEAELTDDALNVSYTYMASAGDRVSLTLSSRQFDALLQIQDAEGTVLISNDDSEGSLNSQIDNYEFEADGDYAIVVTSSDGTETGDYTLTFTISSTQMLSYGDRIEGSFDGSTDEIIYEFEGAADDVITIQLTSDIVDTFLILSNDDGELITDDDSAGNFDALIASYVLPETGTYYITATMFGSGVAGDYVLSLDTSESVSVNLNEPIDYEINGDPVYFTFAVEEGEIISVRVKSEDGGLDTRLSLKDSSGFSIAVDDDSGFGYDPEILDIPITFEGEYVAIVLPTTQQTIGSFTFEVVSKPPIAITCGTSTTLNFTGKLPELTYQLPVETGQMISLTLTGEQTALEELSWTVTQSDDELPITLDWDTAGELTVEMESVSSNDLNITVTQLFLETQLHDMDITCE